MWFIHPQDARRLGKEWMQKALQVGLIHNDEIMGSCGASESSKTPERGNGETAAGRITAAGSGLGSRVAGEDSNFLAD